VKRAQLSSDPREAAWRALCDYERRHPPWDPLLHRTLKGLQGPDRGLAAEILAGTIRHQRRIDAAIERAMGRERKEADLTVWILLRTGAYQLLFLDRVPDHAAVNETVELAKRHMRQAVGFVNAGLRALTRGVNLDDLPLAVRHSVPDEILSVMESLLPADEIEAAAEAMNDPGPLGLRMNPLIAPPDETRQRIEEIIGQPLAAHPLIPDAWTCERSHLAALEPLLEEGALVVQDPASQLVGLLVHPQPGQRIVDLCAAPGGKAAHLAALVNGDASILATDRDRQRLDDLRLNIERLGARCVEVVDWGMAEMLLAAPEPDAILIDAPCSGWGTVRHRSDIKWRTHDLKGQGERQLHLLEAAAPHLESGGALIFSVCSFLPEETTQVIGAFLESDSRFVLQDAREVLPESTHGLVETDGWVRTWPHRHGCDGFFAGRLLRR
jgi:16S rRNA (cytosine967-C5)-methyltransferase